MNSFLDQHSFEAFCSYEPAISSIVHAFPSETIINPYPLSPRTYIARIRDAISSMELNGWETSTLKLEDARKVFASLKHGGPFIFTFADDNNIRCGLRKKLRVANEVNVSDTVIPLRPGEIDARNSEIFSAILLLKSHDIIADPVAFVNVSPLQVSEAEETINTTFFETAPGHYTLL